MSKEIESLFVPYEIALALKELGFDEPCFATFFSVGAWQIDCVEGTLNLKNNTDSEYSILAPLYQQAFKFFRDKFNLFYHTYSVDEFRQDVWWECKIYGKTKNRRDIKCAPANSYEEAELECLKKLIEIVKNDTLHKN